MRLRLRFLGNKHHKHCTAHRIPFLLTSFPLVMTSLPPFVTSLPYPAHLESGEYESPVQQCDAALVHGAAVQAFLLLVYGPVKRERYLRVNEEKHQTVHENPEQGGT